MKGRKVMFCFKTKKALALCLCAITLSICFTGCKANKSKQKTTTNNTSEKFTVSGDNLSLDTTIEKVPDSIDEVVVKPYKIDVEKAKDIFLDKLKKYHMMFLTILKSIIRIKRETR